MPGAERLALSAQRSALSAERNVRVSLRDRQLLPEFASFMPSAIDFERGDEPRK